MSYSRQDEERDDCFEINARIVARQKQALEALQAIMADQIDRDEMAEAAEIAEVILILKGDLDLATPGILL